MLNQEHFEARLAALERQGFTPAQAARLAGQFGDAIEADEAGRWVVRDRETGEELARIEPLD